MKLRIANLDLYIGYEAIAAMTAVLLLDRDNRVIFCFLAAILHELGHLLMMLLCGVHVRAIRLRLFDVLIQSDEAPTFKADVLITGELSHEMYHNALENGVAVLALGHYASETCGVRAVLADLQKTFGLPGVFADIPTGL